MNLMKKFSVQTYNIGMITKPIGEVLKHGLEAGDISWLRHSFKDRFFADPFVIDERDGMLYILVEEYPFWTEKGVISLLKVDKKRFELKDRIVIIDEKTHLSFPFCQLGGASIVPESSKSGATREYTINRETWEIVSGTKVLSEGLIDAVIYKDEAGNEWVIGSHKERPKEDLYLYRKSGDRVDACNDGQPIVSSLEHSRCAGRLFEYNGRLYRPVQDCRIRYGRQTKIMEVHSISNRGIEETEVATLNSFHNPPFNETMHTFNVYGDYIIVDGSRDFIRFPMKVVYKAWCKFSRSRAV